MSDHPEYTPSPSTNWPAAITATVVTALVCLLVAWSVGAL